MAYLSEVRILRPYLVANFTNACRFCMWLNGVGKCERLTVFMRILTCAGLKKAKASSDKNQTLAAARLSLADYESG